eukprot:scaffold201317_cov14-Tisochrysis_lutea.AAC.1
MSKRVTPQTGCLSPCKQPKTLRSSIREKTAHIDICLQHLADCCAIAAQWKRKEEGKSCASGYHLNRSTKAQHRPTRSGTLYPKDMP